MKGRIKLTLTLILVVFAISALIAVGTVAANTEYAIAFSGGKGALGTAPDIMIQEAGEGIILPENTFVKEGYKFSGWSDGEWVYLAGENYTTPKKSVTLTAVWKELAPTEGLKYKLSADESYCSVSVGTATDTDIVIPATYLGKPVKEIEEDGFRDCFRLTSIIIPNGVTTIRDRAFCNCWSLVSIKIPDSLTNIGYVVFLNCDRLASIKFFGSLSRWNAITKQSNWDTGTCYYTVYCTDGEMAKYIKLE